MTFSRRGALALAASAALAACQRKLSTPANAGPMDTKKLDAEFPALAERARPGAFALGVMNLATTATWYWNTDRAFPLTNTVALPIAVAALAQVDARKLALAQRVPFNALDLSPPPSLIGHAWPSPPDGHAGSMPVQDLITLALRESDDTAIDVLMKQLGGPGAISAFLEQKGITGLRVDRYEREIGVELLGMPSFRPEWKDPASFSAARDQVTARERQSAMNQFILDPRDTSTVPAALGFLGLLAGGQLTSPASLALLLRWMQDAPPGRFAGGLPRGVPVARATGETTADLGFTAATAELAIATFPGGRRYALAGFLVGSTGTWKARNALFSDAAKLVAAAVG